MPGDARPKERGIYIVCAQARHTKMCTLFGLLIDLTLLFFQITEKQVEAALYLLWPTQLPELQRRVMLLFKPTARSKSANKDSTPSVRKYLSEKSMYLELKYV